MRSAFHEAAYTKGRTQHQSRQATSLRAMLGSAGLALALSFLILFLFYDRFWWPADEGAYAHVAMRVADGEVLNRDVQDMHAGYVNLANAFALWLFGSDLVSLRYPLFALGMVQALLGYLLLLPRGPVTAAVGAVALTALSFVQFLNPTAHWYCLAVTVAIIATLAWTRPDTPLRADLIGFLLITLFFFRQLSGVLVAIGVVAWLILESEPSRRRGHAWLSGLLCLGMLGGLAAFLFRTTDAIGWLLIGIWPVALIMLCTLRARVDNTDTLALVLRLTRGAVIGAAPLVLYHALNGSLDLWLDDMVTAAFALSDLDYLRQPVYSAMLVRAGGNVLAMEGMAPVANALFWLVLMVLPAINGLIALKSLTSRGTLHPLPFIAAFYAAVSLYNQIPIYLLFSSGLSVVALLWTRGESPAWQRHAAAGLAVALIAVGLHYQAGQSLSRGLAGILRGDRIEVVKSDLPNVSLAVPAEEIASYRHILDVIERETPADGTIFAMPFDPQLYVLSGRQNPFRFYNTAIGLRSESDVRLALLRLTRNPPALVFYRPDDKYNTDLSVRLIGGLKLAYELIERHDGLDIYRYRGNVSAR